MRTEHEEQVAQKIANGEPLTIKDQVLIKCKAQEYRPELRISAKALRECLRVVAAHHEKHVDGWAGAGAVIDAVARFDSCMSKLEGIDPRAMRLALEAMHEMWKIDDLEPVKSFRRDAQNSIRRRSVELNTQARRVGHAFEYEVPSDIFSHDWTEKRSKND